MNMPLPQTVMPAPDSQPLLLLSRASARRPRPLGQILVDLGELSPGDMLKATAMRAREDIRFGDILRANNMVSEAGLYRGLAEQFKCSVADLNTTPPDVRLIDLISPERCLQDGFIPWKRVGAATVIVTCHPEGFAKLRDNLPASFGPVLMAIAPESEIQNALLRARQGPLTQRAETRVHDTESCRGWNAGIAARFAAATVIALMAGFITAPQTTFLVLCTIAVTALVLNTALKLTAALATVLGSRRAANFSSRRNGRKMMQLPTVSLLVPLFHEREIAGRLVRRLARLTYPRELLDVCLIVEEDDQLTQTALDTANLPNWMRQIVVPAGTLKTKPRALNYALDFCRGRVVGVYDAEDAPEPDQLFKVVRRFHEVGPEVVCLQGVLDFYNSRTNWLSRCFTIEYATWFRVVLPGLERLGLVIPLGGTTLFFRREALELIGGWDAHNVTEDADIGVRLARYGFRTELIPTMTEEEANCRFWPWIRQRSRWLKGYGMTWAVHMRSPRKLLADIGPWKFAGFQLVFLGTLTQFLLAPILWSFWGLPLGYWHPLWDIASPPLLTGLTVAFLTSEATSLLIGIFAVATQRHRGLWPWVATVPLYFPLATIAAYKALFEMVSKPFYWDKTAHGLHGASGPTQTVPRPETPPNSGQFQRQV